MPKSKFPIKGQEKYRKVVTSEKVKYKKKLLKQKTTKTFKERALFFLYYVDLTFTRPQFLCCVGYLSVDKRQSLKSHTTLTTQTHTQILSATVTAAAAADVTKTTKATAAEYQPQQQFKKS